MKKVIELKSNNGGSSQIEERSKFGFAGLRNLGCTCYINSVVQQLFNVPYFRWAIMRVSDDKPEKLEVYKEEKPYREYSYDDNMLHQVKTLFGFLEKSMRRDIIPKEFTLTYKENGILPINVT